MSDIKEYRICKKHGNTLFKQYFYDNSIHWKCMKCQSEYVQKRRDHIKLLALAYKGNRCQCCGYNKCVSALEFHHINPEQKDFAIGSRGYTRSWNKVKTELDKCVLVCSNCHREIHSNLLECPTEIIKDDNAVNNLIYKFKDNSIISQYNKISDNIKSIKNYIIPSKEELIELFKKYITFENIGRLYGISGNAIKKWCKKYELPYKAKELKEYINKL